LIVYQSCYIEGLFLQVLGEWLISYWPGQGLQREALCTTGSGVQLRWKDGGWHSKDVHHLVNLVILKFQLYMTCYTNSFVDWHKVSFNLLPPKIQLQKMDIFSTPMQIVAPMF
jgi:hypothetical protein